MIDYRNIDLVKVNNMKMKVWLGVIIALFGAALIVVALGLRSATYTWTERINDTKLVEGNRGRAAAVGAGVGVAAGAGVGVALGGVGIACCGTGIGIPAGVVCLAIANSFVLAGWKFRSAIKT